MKRGRVRRDEPVLTVAATFGVLRLIFADEFVEVLKKADEDDEQRAGKPDEEHPRHQDHSGMGESDHTGILMHARKRATQVDRNRSTLVLWT